MKLAWKELKHSKSKYLLIEAIVILMIFMVLFLSGLASGLGRAMDSVLANMDAEYFVISNDSEKLLTASELTEENLDEVHSSTGDEITPFNIQRMNINAPGIEEKINVTYIAVDASSFLNPEVKEGSKLKDTDGEYGIVLNDSLKAEGINLGDVIEDATTGVKMQVVGFTEDQMFTHSPVGFITLDTYTAIRTEYNPSYETIYHAVAVQGSDIENISIEGLEVYDKATIINSLPGYTAEQATIQMILWVLVLVSAAILGVFFYVITIQKQKEFGVLKAIGMSMKELTGVIVGQISTLAALGMIIGNALAFGISAILPEAMPFYLQASSALVISLVFVVISVMFSLFSTRRVAKVDPLITIGGNN